MRGKEWRVDDLSTIRSLLLAPGNDEHKLARAATSGAGALIADLEDSVPPERRKGRAE
jgi:citrate lyase beta subunit